MSARTYLWIATLLSGAGAAFAGYLSLTRAVRGVCAFDEPCPLFLGRPACYTGFALFALALVVSLIALGGRVRSVWPAVVNTGIASAGILFAGSLSLSELERHAGYRLGLPTCAYGLIFFFALLIASLGGWISHWRPRGLTKPAYPRNSA
jgi:hypothetical protein